MNYPDDFNIPTFTAGKSVAVSRAMGIGIMSGFLIIAFLCGLLIWANRSTHVEPYIIVTSGVNDQWHVIKPDDGHLKIEMTGSQLAQQSLIWKFVQNWFLVSDEPDVNSEIWDGSCRRIDCDSVEGMTPCPLYCATGDDLFRRFKDGILPTYEKMAQEGEYWSPSARSIRIIPVGNVTDAGGTWRVQLSVSIGTNTNMAIMAYAKVARSQQFYPQTMGYYIADFNAYRIN